MDSTEFNGSKLISEPIIDWDDLCFDLKNERAVLVLGPEFYNSDEGFSVKELLFHELQKRGDNGILHFYPSNGIFLFKSEFYKTRAQKISSQFYRSVQIDDHILQKIIGLPFKMIINTAPDKSLLNWCRRNGVECQFDYFTWHANKIVPTLFRPDVYNPLIYNLFGSVDAYDSIVLDFEDIFDHLKHLLNNVNISEVTRAVLNETDTYIFIGFHLEKWDTQLLFRYLNMKEHGFDDSKKNYTQKSNAIDNNSESFFRQQFNIKYYGAPIDFLNEIHRVYFNYVAQEDANEIKGMSLEQVVQQYISNGEIEKAINFLTNYINTNKGEESINQLTLLKASFTQYVKIRRSRTETFETINILRQRLIFSILEFVKLL